MKRQRQVCALVTSVALAAVLGATDVHGGSAPKVAATAPASKNAAPITDTKRFAENTGFFRASSVVGSAVKDVTGKDAGKIEDLLLDHRGHIGYAVVSFGGFLGIGDKLFAVPWDAVVLESGNRTVYIDVKKESLEKSPSFAADKYPDTNDRDWTQGVKKAWSDASITAAVKTKLAGPRRPPC
jgi:sporulation protein YlmC with PRC-barrel domain